MVGSAVHRLLQSQGYSNILPVARNQVDFTIQADTLAYLEREKPEYLIIAAARVGGIIANNTYPANFLYENLEIQTNLIHGAYLTEVKKLLFTGSSCIYPRDAPQPIREEALLSGVLEPTNEAYAIAKIIGIKMCDAYKKQYGCNFISLMPCNLYGYGDNFHPQNSHVIPGLIQKFHLAKKNNDNSVTCWGSGKPRREFMFVDDLASAVLYAMNNYNGPGHLNVGIGSDVTIRELANLICEIVGFRGEILWDRDKPDGTPQKLLDIGRIKSLGWSPKTLLKEGIEKTYDWFLNHGDKIRGHLS